MLGNGLQPLLAYSGLRVKAGAYGIGKPGLSAASVLKTL